MYVRLPLRASFALLLFTSVVKVHPAKILDAGFLSVISYVSPSKSQVLCYN